MYACLTIKYAPCGAITLGTVLNVRTVLSAVLEHPCLTYPSVRTVPCRITSPWPTITHARCRAYRTMLCTCETIRMQELDTAIHMEIWNFGARHGDRPDHSGFPCHVSDEFQMKWVQMSKWVSLGPNENEFGMSFGDFTQMRWNDMSLKNSAKWN
jgi:hypothetical protein